VKDIIIDTASVVVTLHCNLNCKLCNTGVPFRKNPMKFEAEDITAAIRSYFSVVKFVRKLSFTGGEPFLRLDIGEIIQNTLDYQEQFDILEIITNGTIVPNDSVLDILEEQNHKIFILIDHYGSLSKNADKFSQILTERKVKHLVRKYYGEDVYHHGWVDLTQFRKMNTPEQAKKVYHKCAVPNVLKKVSGAYKEILLNNKDSLYGVYTVLVNGIVYRCMRPFLAVERGIDFPTEGQFVSIVDHHKSLEQVNDEIVKMFSLEYPAICEYCPGMCDDSQRFTPALQARKE
jgi:organic radical activating enzyme